MIVKKRLDTYADVEEQVSLKTRTTFRIGGNCRYFIYPKNEICFLRILQILKEENISWRIFGKGSNILCSDDDFDGAVICLDRYMSDFYFEEDGSVMAQAGCSIILLAHEAMKRSFSGLEFASGIPGTVGGAVYMNAGAYKSDMAAVLQEVYVYKDGAISCMKKEELDFAYRHSIFQTHSDWVVLGCRIKLNEGNQKEIRDLMDSRRKRRMDAQPLNKPCAGSTFRNPVEKQAWQLIDEAQLRGARIGGAMVSMKHSNFIVNEENATAKDVLALIEKIQKTVKEQSGIELRCEVEMFNWKK